MGAVGVREVGEALTLNTNTSIIPNDVRNKRQRGKNEAAQKSPNVVPRTVNIWLFVVVLFLPVQFTQSG